MVFWRGLKGSRAGNAAAASMRGFAAARAGRRQLQRGSGRRRPGPAGRGVGQAHAFLLARHRAGAGVALTCSSTARLHLAMDAHLRAVQAGLHAMFDGVLHQRQQQARWQWRGQQRRRSSIVQSAAARPVAPASPRGTGARPAARRPAQLRAVEQRQRGTQEPVSEPASARRARRGCCTQCCSEASELNRKCGWICAVASCPAISTARSRSSSSRSRAFDLVRAVHRQEPGQPLATRTVSPTAGQGPRRETRPGPPDAPCFMPTSSAPGRRAYTTEVSASGGAWGGATSPGAPQPTACRPGSSAVSRAWPSGAPPAAA
jgi:hypothetical protein